MVAIEFTRYGPPDVALQLVERERPLPSDGEVLVRVHASSVNAMEWRPFTFPLFFLRIVAAGYHAPKHKEFGTDLAGVIEAVGPRVTQFKPGDEVFGFARSSFAEYVCAKADLLVAKPSMVQFEAAAATPVAGVTALQALRQGRLQRGQKVLIYGAGGGVGMFAVQIAKASGAEVTAVCGAGNVDLVRALGADDVIDYEREAFETRGRRYDLVLVLNGRQPLRRYRRALAADGTCMIVGGAMRQLLTGVTWMVLSRFTRRKVRVCLTRPRQQDLSELKDLLASGRLATVIDRRYPLARVADAIAYLMGGHARGKVVIVVHEETMPL